MNPHVNIRKKKTTDVLAKSEIKCITLTINTSYPHLLHSIPLFYGVLMVILCKAVVWK